jgi:hypothetical protein
MPAASASSRKLRGRGSRARGEGVRHGVHDGNTALLLSLAKYDKSTNIHKNEPDIWCRALLRASMSSSSLW